MSDTINHKNRRILVIDDNRAIHDDFRKILAGNSGGSSTLDEFEEDLFGCNSSKNSLPTFEIDSAYQGQEGLDRVKQYRLKVRELTRADFDAAARLVHPQTTPEEMAKFVRWKESVQEE